MRPIAELWRHWSKCDLNVVTKKPRVKCNYCGNKQNRHASKCLRHTLKCKRLADSKALPAKQQLLELNPYEELIVANVCDSDEEEVSVHEESDEESVNNHRRRQSESSTSSQPESITNNMTQTIVVNDVFDELREENARLSDELSFANKCVALLLKYKCYLYDCYINKDNQIDCNDNQLRELENQFNLLLIESKSKSSVEMISLDDNEIIIDNQQNIDNEEIVTLTQKMQKPSKRDNQENISSLISNNYKNSFVYNKGENTRNKQSFKVSHKSKQSIVDYESLKSRFKCDWIECNYTFDSRSQLIQHQNKHLGLTPFQCDINGCDKAFYTRKILRSHKNTVHQLEKNYACHWPGCELAFKASFQLNKHMKIHTTPHSEKPFACNHPNCDYRSLSKYSLNVHKLVHSDEKLFRCQECGKSFKLESNLRSHAHTHSAVPRFKCDWPDCDAVYRDAGALRRHKLKHQNIDIPKHRCDWPGCEYESPRLDLLKVHKAVHSEERNHECTWPSCEKRFKAKKNLREHMRIHLDDRRYKCQWPGCDYRCVQSYCLKLHFTKVHCKQKI